MSIGPDGPGFPVAAVLLAALALTGSPAAGLGASPAGSTPFSTAWQDTQPISPCDAAVRAAVAQAEAGDLAAASALLEDAAVRCPEHVGVVRELSGVRFREGRLREAEELALRLVVMEPEGAWGWDLLGTLRYLDNDAVGALGPWNRIGRPAVESVEDAATGLRAGQLLTPSSLTRAERRLGALPAVARARVEYRPTPGGGARVLSYVVRHPRHNLTRGSVPAHLLRALGGSLQLLGSNLLGWDERVRLDGSIDRGLRQVELEAMAPPPGGRIAAAGGKLRHTMTTLPPPPGQPQDPEVIRRSGARLQLRPWPGARLQSEAAAGVDHWSEDGPGGAGDGPGGDGPARGRDRGTHAAVEARARADLAPGLGLRLGGAWWSGGFGTWEVVLDAARGPGRGPTAGNPRLEAGVGIRARGGLVARHGEAPFDLVPRFGARASATHLMRAAALLSPSGNRWLHGTLEVTAARSTSLGFLLGGAVFLDGVHGLGDSWADGSRIPIGEESARPGSAEMTVKTIHHVGAGLRLAVPGMEGWLRVDGAVDPTSGRGRVSVAWVRPGWRASRWY